MRAIFCLFDSLNKTAIEAYGLGSVKTPNFDRFAERSIVYDNHYVGSLPCMPARRDLHTGRMNFMHRSWGPLEPFDNSFPELLRNGGIYSHLVTDHLHYFEDGGATYHNRFTSYDFIRGQEYDPWKAMVEPPLERFREIYANKHYPFGEGEKPHGRAAVRFQHAINNTFLTEEEDFPGPRCFASAFDFLDVNHKADNWLMMLECFDPHEPFRAPDRFKEAYKTGWNGGVLDWPLYAKVNDSPEEIAEIRANYAALVSMCDEYFGKLLDYMDEHDMWKDTALIVSTDHGLLLSEHDWWGKNLQPYYQELANIPLMVHDPRTPERGGTRSDRLTQTHDLMPTLLDLFGVDVPAEVCGSSVLAEDDEHEVAIYGMFGGPIGVNDGHYAYYIYPEDLYAPGLYEYTLMPLHIRAPFSSEEMKTAELREPFGFTKEMPILKIDALMNAARIPIHDGEAFQDIGTRLYDLEGDPQQESPFRDETIETRLRDALCRVLADHDCPEEIYTRYGLAPA
ncbi:MAG: sulfatase [Martelella sp.]|uniref:sulfatase n=1 Tax=unclassified Martelella TaxID=2629616 RepID=UPI000C5E16EC|nr:MULTISPECIES: sulfatase [unclassified Martelella]MAU19768.1 sulfatase [Martelella sp.]|tara:strand:- start:133 stop:1659 length:1527 start_codon:yes stop_codon:yes gene_type:complete